MAINIAIKGGLGNQLFQYALGSYFSGAYKVPVFYDVLPLMADERNLTKRPFLLSRLIPGLQFTNAAIHSIFYTQGNSLPAKLFKKLYRMAKRYTYISETDPFKIKLNPRHTYYLDGYWQSAGLAKAAAAQLNNAAISVLSGNAYAKEIAASAESVAVHIRRGDYVSNPFINSYHGSCDITYYHSAMAAMEKKVSVSGYFVFSDDIAWAKENIKSRHHLTFIEGNVEDPIADLFLMKSCRHQVIANSSFSCWAAYLNGNPHKTIIAPVNWTRKEKTSTLPLFEDTWILV